MVEFGEQLRRAREAKGMTQQSLAEQLYVTRQSVLNGVNFGSFRTWEIIAFVTVIFMMPTLLGALSSFFFFVRSQNRKIWALSIAAVSLWGIFQVLYSLGISIFIAKHHNELTDQLFSVEYYSIKAVLIIAIYFLVLYQTYTLYKKRVVAVEVVQVSVDASR